MSQILAMAKRLQEAEETMASLRAADARLTHVPREDRESRGSNFVPRMDHSDASHQVGDVSIVKGDTVLSGLTEDESMSEAPLISDLSLDENGKVRRYLVCLL